MKLFWCKDSKDMIVAENKNNIEDIILEYWESSIGHPISEEAFERMLDKALSMKWEEYTGDYFTTISLSQEIGEVLSVQRTKLFLENRIYPEYVGTKYINEDEIFCDECLEFWVENDDHSFYCDNCGAYNCNRQAEATDRAYDAYRDAQITR